MNNDRTRFTISICASGAPLAAVLAAAGCMVGPDYKPPETKMPAAYQELTTGQAAVQAVVTADSPAEIRWWQQFLDDGLTSLVERALTANYGVAVAQARLREARAGRQMAQAMLYPQIGVGASALRYRLSESVISLPGLDSQDSLFQVGFDAAWAVDIFGGIRRGVEAAEANEQASDAERRGIVVMVAAETARAYLELRGAQRQYQIAVTTLDEQRQTLAVTENKNRNGLASELEVLRARTEVEATAAQVPPLQQAVRQYIHVLSTLLGQEPTALGPELEQPRPIPAIPAMLAVGIPSDLLRRRPDIQVAERQFAAATAGVGVATAELFPQLLLGGFAGLSSKDSGDLFKNDSRYYLAGPSVNWNLFDGGLRKAGIKLSEARVDASRAAYEDTVLRAFREVESSLVAVDRTQEQVRDLERLSASARESAAIARRDYERGILDQLTVLDAQRQSNRAEMMLAQGQVQLIVNTVTLYKSLGGGWEVVEPAPTTDPPVSESNNQGNPR
jgi:NodT family efflux transporter outer membrane factor (OMF) lipoprotein